MCSNSITCEYSLVQIKVPKRLFHSNVPLFRSYEGDMDSIRKNFLRRTIIQIDLINKFCNCFLCSVIDSCNNPPVAIHGPWQSSDQIYSPASKWLYKRVRSTLWRYAFPWVLAK